MEAAQEVCEKSLEMTQKTSMTQFRSANIYQPSTAFQTLGWAARHTNINNFCYA
jgi:hypothetical protein